MKMHDANGFTVLELLCVIVVIAILATLILPALISAKRSAQGIQCMSNQRQLTLAWRMYSQDNADVFPINAAENQYQDARTEWVCGILTWAQDNGDNTNEHNLCGALMGPYVEGQIKIFKCPADSYDCLEGGTLMPRVRSVSMNCFVGAEGIENGESTDYNYGWPSYAKMSDVVRPAPSALWLLMDEHPDSINDGFFLFIPGGFFDMPAIYHNGCSGVSFVDGHAEIHQWVETCLWPVPNCSLADDGGLHEPPEGTDVRWMMAHSTGPQN